MHTLLAWVDARGPLLWWTGALSLLSFLGTLILVPILVVKLPEDYFLGPDRATHRPPPAHPAVRITLLVAKNLLGATLLVTGLALLVLPGQGLLTLMIGVTLLDFPGKFRLERRFIKNAAVRKTINWIRRRYGRPPLRV